MTTPSRGQPAYRIVFETLRYVLADFMIRFPNLVIRLGHGNVERGGLHLGGAISGRRRAEWYLPRKGDLLVAGRSGMCRTCRCGQGKACVFRPAAHDA